MKRIKFIRLIATMFILALLGASLPAPAMAAGEAVLNVTPAFGPVGTAVNLSGHSFGVETRHYIYFSNQQIGYNDYISALDRYERVMGNVLTTSNGTFPQTQVTIPSRLSEGNRNVNKYEILYIYVTVERTVGAGENERSDMQVKGKVEFRVTDEVDIALSHTQGFVDDDLQVEGEGFWPGEQVEVYFDGYDITSSYFEGEPKAASTGIGAGSFSVTVPVPEAAYGNRAIKIKGVTSGAEVTKNFKVLPKINLSEDKGAVGDVIYIDGTGFKGLSYIEIFFGNDSLGRVNRRTNAGGSFSFSFPVPEDAAPGNYVIEAVVDDNDYDVYARTNFEVKVYLEPEITLNAAEWTVGSTVTIEGVEFNNNKNITLDIGGAAVTPDASIKSTSSGTFSGSFAIPELPAGTHTLKASDGTVETTATFTVTHKAGINKTSGQAGDEVAVSGTGFKAGTALTITFDNDDVTPAGAKTDAKGSFDLSFTVPAVAEGDHEVKITVDSATVTKTFATDVNMIMSSESGKAGTEVAVTAEGLKPSAVASIYFGSTKLTATTTSDQGNLSFVFNIPVVAEGVYPVKIEVNGVTVSRNFTVSAEVTLTPVSGK
ncbi:MAG: IPT/TIG domain-containing protein, partial [Dehalococcoidales bacterium]|nr:IPT/TIG domain-containing protein [Dehalococcoidales bacterium]